MVRPGDVGTQGLDSIPSSVTYRVTWDDNIMMMLIRLILFFASNPRRLSLNLKILDPQIRGSAQFNAHGLSSIKKDVSSGKV